MNKSFMFPKYDENGISRIAIPDIKSILFLDIDGVICPYSNDSRWCHDLRKLSLYLANKYKDDIYLKVPEGDLGGAFYDWDLMALARVKNILDITDSELVIHSDLRDWNDLDCFKALFKLYGMDEYVIDRCIPKFDKEVAIRKYLEENEDIENYVVIDDDNDLSVFKDNFVLTNNYINDKNVEDACKVLLRY